MYIRCRVIKNSEPFSSFFMITWVMPRMDINLEPALSASLDSIPASAQPFETQIPETLPSPHSIRILPQALISRIAAGEVVERPASMVKELVENALDAGARSIHVDLIEGGKKSVRVSDDGAGMSPPDLELCCLPHATSKLSDEADLLAIETLGFRGEALPSMAAVSRFAITSRTRARAAHTAHTDTDTEHSAWRIEISAGEPAQPQARPAAGAYGTLVEALDLFYALPARAKFLKGAASESAACADTLLRLALTRPDVAFTLKQERHSIFDLHACAPRGTPLAKLPLSAWLRRAREVLGASSSKGLIEVDYSSGSSSSEPGSAPYRLFGLLSPPAQSASSRSSIYLAVNGRAVKDRVLSGALLEAYRHLLPPKRYPVAVLFLELPGSDVDINVHPTKAEVRFRLQGRVYALFHSAIRHACGISAAPPAPALLPSAPRAPLGAPPADNGQRRFDLWSRPAERSLKSLESLQTPGTLETLPAPEALPDRAAEEPAPFARPASPAPSEKTAARNDFAVAPFRVLGQAGGSYIVLEDDSGVKLIDQHALHERVLFEELFARAQGLARGDSQGLLIPETLELTPVQAAVFFGNAQAAEILAELGFEVDAFGQRAVRVRAVPAVLKGHCAPYVRDILDALGLDAEGPEKRPTERSFYREKAAYILSCKGAIKAGERLSHEQMTLYISEYRRRVGASAFTCPHGRPLALEISWDDLERAVGRQ